MRWRLRNPGLTLCKELCVEEPKFGEVAVGRGLEEHRFELTRSYVGLNCLVVDEVPFRCLLVLRQVRRRLRNGNAKKVDQIAPIDSTLPIEAKLDELEPSLCAPAWFRRLFDHQLVPDPTNGYSNC